MTTFRASGRLLMGWLIVALATLGQAPRLYGDGEVDPSCPTCAAKGQLDGPQMPAHALPQGIAHQDLPPQEGPSVELPVAQPEPVFPVPIVRLKIHAPVCAEMGKEMDYRIKVENCSPLDAHNVTVRMQLPASVKILQASPQVHQRDPELQWNLGTMPGHGCHDLVVKIVPLGLADIKNCTRVTFEHGQCVTTKVVAFAPEGSADGKGPGTIPGGVGPGGVGPGGIAPVNPAARDGFEVKVLGPTEPVAAGQMGTFKVAIFNKSDRQLFKAGSNLEWSDELEFVKSSQDLLQVGNLKAWPKAATFEVLDPGESRSVDLTFRLKPLAPAGRYCVKASASAITSRNPNESKNLEVVDQACTEFRRVGIPGMTLEMFDKEDPILKNGQTSYPIRVRNLGSAPITGLRVKARVPDLLKVVSVTGGSKQLSELKPNGEYWVEYWPIPVLDVGKEEVFEIFVKGNGQVGDARFHVEMTADQLDKGPAGETRWIVEEESTTLVPDEEMRARILDISRKMRSNEKSVRGMVTSGK